ncbi:basic proline-rich protein [Mustela putorius furo]|uniref:Basic proline-rich protein n=1 Tax=Mustela putorius furo TaxID=9669 RepID=A0A8U0NE05_MUSPF|nr:basic proline-rich protein [Mustela putorius furo]
MRGPPKSLHPEDNHLAKPPPGELRTGPPRPPPHTNTGTYRPFRGDVGSRRPEEGQPLPPSPPLRPRAACHRAPLSGEAAGPRGPEGRAKSLARAGSLLHMEPATGGVECAWTVAADRALSAPLGTSRRRGPEARAKLSRKGGSRGPGAARGRRRGKSGDSAVGAAARRTTPEHRTQRPHHFRQAPPLRAAGRHYTRTRDVGRSAAHVTAGSPVRAQPSARRERNPPRARAPSLRRRTQAERTVPAPAQWPAAPTQALLPPALGSAGIPSPGQPRREPRPYLPAAARVPPPPPSRVLEPGPDAAGRRSQGALTHRLTQREVSCQQTPAGGGGAPGVLATVSEALLGTGAHGLPRERPFRLPTSAERDGRPPGGRGALRDARGGQRETQMCRSVWAAHLPGRPRCRAPPCSSHALSLNSQHHHRHPRPRPPSPPRASRGPPPPGSLLRRPPPDWVTWGRLRAGTFGIALCRPVWGLASSPDCGPLENSGQVFVG